jgi:hypothetical protein
MNARKAVTALVAWAAALGAGIATAAPAAAGGIIVIGSPSYNNFCANGHSSGPAGATRQVMGSVSGLLGQLPVSGPLNQCGGADLPVLQHECDPVDGNFVALPVTNCPRVVGL